MVGSLRRGYSLGRQLHLQSLNLRLPLIPEDYAILSSRETLDRGGREKLYNTSVPQKGAEF